MDRNYTTLWERLFAEVHGDVSCDSCQLLKSVDASIARVYEEYSRLTEVLPELISIALLERHALDR